MNTTTEALEAAERLEAALDPDKRGGWTRLVHDGETGDEIADLRTVIAAVRSKKQGWRRYMGTAQAEDGCKVDL